VLYSLSSEAPNKFGDELSVLENRSVRLVIVVPLSAVNKRVIDAECH
jgi:hypothetical protein